MRNTIIGLLLATSKAFQIGDSRAQVNLAQVTAKENENEVEVVDADYYGYGYDGSNGNRRRERRCKTPKCKPVTEN